MPRGITDTKLSLGLNLGLLPFTHVSTEHGDTLGSESIAPDMPKSKENRCSIEK